MSGPLPPIPPPIPPERIPGTEEWARWQLVHVMSSDDARAVTDLLTLGLAAHYTRLWSIRTEYARVCHERRWPGHTARLAWACLEALLKPEDDDDIPF